MKRTDQAMFGDADGGSTERRTASMFYGGDGNNNNMGGGSGGGSRQQTPDSDRSYGSMTSNTVYKSSRPASRQSVRHEDIDFDNDNQSGNGRSPTAATSWLDRGNSLDEAVYVNEEIRPGVMLEGYAIEI